MIRNRLIPVLLLKGNGLVKTVQFSKPKYVGDPINALKIFNDKEVDELVFLDILASKEGRGPNFDLLEKLTSECFMPMGYGGGITKTSEIERLFSIGFEKVIINQACLNSTNLISEAVKLCGSQSVIGSVDYKSGLWGGRKLYNHVSGSTLKTSIEAHIDALVDAGIGELLLNHVNRDGMMSGYDIEFLHQLSARLTIPLVACGGAGSIDHITELLRNTDVSAAAAGSMFVFHGPHKAVVINYPNLDKIEHIVNVK